MLLDHYGAANQTFRAKVFKMYLMKFMKNITLSLNLLIIFITVVKKLQREHNDFTVQKGIN